MKPVDAQNNVHEDGQNRNQVAYVIRTRNEKGRKREGALNYCMYQQQGENVVWCDKRDVPKTSN